MATTMVPDAGVRPEVFPTDRLMENGMARPEVRQGLRRIADVRNAVTVASVWFWVVVLIGGAVWLDNPLAYLAAFILMGPMYAALRHPHARSGPQAPVHQQAGQRLGRHLAHRLSDLDADLDLPTRPLRPPQGGVRTPRAGHRLLRRLSLRPAHAGPAPGPRRGGHLRVEELHARCSRR